MNKTDFTYFAADRKEIHASKWEPDSGKSPKALVQIVHGMAEHRNRYNEFASFLADEGFICFAEDHRGHGETMEGISDRGFFAEKNGWTAVTDDVILLSEKMIQEYTGLPFFLFGFSMGSFLARTYLIRKPEKLEGVILGGTASGQGVLGKIGKFVSRIEMNFKGKRTPSPLLDKLSFGAYNSKFKPNRTKFDWISRDQGRVDNYISDPLCAFISSCTFFQDMLTGLEFISSQTNINRVPSDIPVLLISGASDPVGNMGKGPEKVFISYKKAGLNDIQLKLYPEARHGILAEINRMEIFRYIRDWIENRI